MFNNYGCTHALSPYRNRTHQLYGMMLCKKHCLKLIGEKAMQTTFTPLQVQIHDFAHTHTHTHTDTHMCTTVVLRLTHMINLTLLHCLLFQSKNNVYEMH